MTVHRFPSSSSAGSWDQTRCTLKTPAELEALEIELDLGSQARSLDLATRSVALADGPRSRLRRSCDCDRGQP